jgi:hypothetical protein
VLSIFDVGVVGSIHSQKIVFLGLSNYNNITCEPQFLYVNGKQTLYLSQC